MASVAEINEHNRRERDVTRSVLQFTKELNGLFYKNEEGKSSVSSRMQLIGCFSIIDVMANYWFEYLGRKDGTPSTRFYEYLNKFCFTKENDNYSNHSDLKKMTTEDFYNLRCGLVHFYGLSVKNVIITDHTITEADEYEYKKAFRKIRPNLIFLKPTIVKDMIYRSVELMLLTMADNIHKAQPNNKFEKMHISGIGRIYEKMQREGAVLVPKAEMDDIKSKL